MKKVGIICEYNPFHNGHQRQFQIIREHFGADCIIVCLMSGNYVQRGTPAIFDKSLRAQAAVQCGADLVLELPTEIALSSAEGFAAGGVKILSKCCDILCFGTESMDSAALEHTAQALLSPNFSVHLKDALASGISFPAARQQALQQMKIPWSLSNPNDILGVEYTKAILKQGSFMALFPIFREGSYHAEQLNTTAPSATAVRNMMLKGRNWADAIPSSAAKIFDQAPRHTLEAGERAVIAKLRTMSEDDFAALPYGSEGLWRKLMKASRNTSDLSSIVNAVKSKRYTRTRIDRMILCAFLELQQDDFGGEPETVRILAFNDRGRAVLRTQPSFRNAGDAPSDREKRFGDLYGIFCIDGIEPPGIEEKRRIYYFKE